MHKLDSITDYCIMRLSRHSGNIFILLVIFFFVMPLFSQAKPAAEKPEAETAGSATTIVENNAGSSYEHTAGLVSFYTMPSGNVSKYDAGIAFGINYHYTLTGFINKTSWLAFMRLPGILWQAPAELQYNSFKGAYSTARREYSTEVSLLLFHTGIKANYLLSNQFKLFGGMYTGMSQTSGNTQSVDGKVNVSASSLDALFIPEVGAGYAITPDIDINLHLRYMMVFETVTGNFLQAGIGANYRFRPAAASSSPEVKVQPEEKDKTTDGEKK